MRLNPLYLIGFLLLAVGCIPDIPTGNEVDPNSGNYDLPTPKNFSVERLGNGEFEISIDPESNLRISGQELFLVVDGEILEEYPITVNATRGIGFTNSAFLEYPQTYALRSFFHIDGDNNSALSTDRRYSEFVYYTATFADLVGSANIQTLNDNLYYQPKFYNPDFNITIEYAPDSVNFSVLRYGKADSKSSTKYSGFIEEFNNDIDGVFRHTLSVSGIESVVISTLEGQYSKCFNTPAPTTAPSITGREWWTGQIGVDWTIHNECYDEIFLYSKTNEESNFRVIERRTVSPAVTLFTPNSTNAIYSFKVAGVQHGIRKFESETIVMRYQDGKWSSDE